MKACRNIVREVLTRSKRRRRLVLFVALVVAILSPVVGCTPSNVGIVTGMVTVDGVPVKNGIIAFFADDGLAPTTGALIEDGYYRAEVRPGACRVEIRLQKATKPLPVKYHDESELKLDVQVGDNEQNYDLSTK